MPSPDSALRVFSTCPPSSDYGGEEYLDRVAKIARWSEQANCEGILVYADNSIADPWLVSQIILQNTRRLCPLLAIQPAYSHPFTVAKQVATLAYFHRRRVHLNMIAGGFANDLAALGDGTPHDKRYGRLAEYTTIVKELLSGEPAVTYRGEFYQVDKLRLKPPVMPELRPDVFISGSSDAGMAAARVLGAVAVKYPKPAQEEFLLPLDGVPCGIRVGIISRKKEMEAWHIARTRFPEDRKGELTHSLAMKTSDSSWHRQLSSLQVDDCPGPYWLHPFRTYKTFCPYLVGSYDVVGQELARYFQAGYRTVILDIPATEEELFHVGQALKLATLTRV